MPVELSEKNFDAIGQIAIAVSDIDIARDFYQNIMGLEHLFDAPPGLAFFQCGDVRLMVTIQNGEIKDHNTSVVYYQTKNIESVAKDLKSKGVMFEQEPQLVAKMPDHDLWMGFIRDPDQNLIGIMSEIATI